MRKRFSKTRSNKNNHWWNQLKNIPKREKKDGQRTSWFNYWLSFDREGEREREREQFYSMLSRPKLFEQPAKDWENKSFDREKLHNTNYDWLEQLKTILFVDLLDKKPFLMTFSLSFLDEDIFSKKNSCLLLTN